MYTVCAKFRTFGSYLSLFRARYVFVNQIVRLAIELSTEEVAI